jgi:hypothetical protein
MWHCRQNYLFADGLKPSVRIYSFPWSVTQQKKMTTMKKNIIPAKTNTGHCIKCSDIVISSPI